MSKDWKDFNSKNPPLDITIQVRVKTGKKELIACCHNHSNMKLVRLDDGSFRVECEKLGCNWHKEISLADYEYRKK